MSIRRMRMNVIYVCPLFSALSVFSIEKFKFKFEKVFFLNLEVINGGKHLITAASERMRAALANHFG